MADLKRPTTSADRTKLMIGASFAAYHSGAQTQGYPVDPSPVSPLSSG